VRGLLPAYRRVVRVPDEEALASGIAPGERAARGAYFTPASLVELTLELARPHVPPGPLTILDPACGAGAFLHGARRVFPRARLLGLELAEDALEICRARVPEARLARGDALRGALPPLLEASEGFELWVGNPPYNGTSALLRDPVAYARVRELLGTRLRPGTSLRDDFAFFLLLAADRLSRREGALAFITTATLLDAFAHAPLRSALLERLALREVVELGAGAFSGTRVRTCVTVWTTRRDHPRSLAVYRPRVDSLSTRSRLEPVAPDFLLRPIPSAAAELDENWSSGEPITTVLPISFPGLKTRFDELLVSDDPERLFARVSGFLACEPAELEGFAERHRLPERTWPKLLALKQATAGVEPSRAALRPFVRYAGARHRGRLPASARAFCYLDRRLIPRGDHRLRGDYDPHRGAVKLLFNVRELPLSAALLEEEGCVHDHRHARFAPLLVPARVLERGLSPSLSGDLGPLVPNLSPRALLAAARLGGSRALFDALVRFINSPPVQDVWAPAFGAFRELPIPLDTLG
jgi:hypothetical protein